MLCSSCTRVLIEAPQDRSGALSFQSDTNGTWLHHESFSQFKAAAASQCVVCARLWCYRFTLQQSLDQSFHRLGYGKGEEFQPNSAQSPQLKVLPLSNADLPIPDRTCAYLEFKDRVHVNSARIAYAPIPGGSLHLNLYWGETVENEGNFDFKYDSFSTGSLESIAFINFQLKRCDADHQCFPEETGRFRPTRLLDIAGAIDEDGTVKLVTTADIPNCGPYVALSYCWGESNTITLNEASAPALRQGIKRSLLPQTFQDAVSVCLDLDIRYLWIDALCIFQDPDDLTDWRKESALMSEVYMQAYFTIVASVSTNSEGGLFRARNPQVLRANHEFEYKSELAELAGKQLSLTINTYDDIDLWRAEALKTPVGTRGWTVQERMLSRRKIFFGARQVLWECDELQACEVQPFGHPHTAKRHDGQFHSCLESLHKQRTILPQDQHYFWDNLMVHYSRCNLTRYTDKLVALSGIARAIGTATGDQYIAGMWKRFIGIDILRWRTINFSPGKRSGQYVAPTFSWASSNGIITFERYFTNKSGIYLVDSSIEATPNEYGAVTAGYIRVQSFLRLLTLTVHNELPSSQSSWTIHLSDLPAISIDCLADDVKSPYIIGKVRFWFDIDPRTLDNGDGETKTVSIYYTGPRTSKSRGTWSTPFLLLAHKNAGTFERVGIMDWSLSPEEEQSFVESDRAETKLWPMDSLLAGKDEIPCESYDIEKQLHTYCIE